MMDNLLKDKYPLSNINLILQKVEEATIHMWNGEVF